MSCRRKACPPGQLRPSWIKKKTFEDSSSVGELIGVRPTARCLIVAITICSWIAISNHCALSAAVAKKTETTGGCPFHSKPAKPQPKPAATQCCKILRATAAASLKNPAPAIVDFVPLNFREFVIFFPPKVSIRPATLDTGPPVKTSFTDLYRSLRAHAPPFLS